MTAGSTAYPSDGTSVDTGRSLYLHGRMPTGEPIQGIVRGDIPVSGTQLACAGCHRRSGLGSSEGGNLAPPVTARALYSARAAQRRELPVTDAGNPVRRPPYTDAALRRALRDGIGAAGRPLDPLMPRYRLDDAQIDALLAYLGTLGARPAPGVDDTTLHLATIITPGADPRHRDAMLQVLNTFFEDRSASTRNEPGRAARAPWHIDWKLQAYREIRLHTWEIAGPPESWDAQLQALYAAQPVFAVVSGIGSGHWAPIHSFCETNELPCLFPNTALPVARSSDFYSVYFNEGMALEGRVAARFLADRDEPGRGPVLQFIADTPEAEAAAAAFRDAFPQPRHDIAVPAAPGQVDAIDWRALRARYRPRAVVIWGTMPMAGKLLMEITPGTVDAPLVMLSSTLAPSQLLPPELRGQVYMIHPTAPPRIPARGEGRIHAWLHSRNLQPGDISIAMNTYFAATITTGAIKMLVGNYSREYLIERIEHSTENALSSGAYPHLSLGQNQRFASKGAYVVAPSDTPAGAPEHIWIVP